MKQNVLKIVVKVINQSIRHEADSVCIGVGYQPSMPDSVKRFKKGKKK